jgi:hypothetical protein
MDCDSDSSSDYRDDPEETESSEGEEECGVVEDYSVWLAKNVEFATQRWEREKKLALGICGYLKDHKKTDAAARDAYLEWYYEYVVLAQP